MSDSKNIIRNCKFKFKCHQKWEGLDKTDTPDMRYCSECNENVLLIKTQNQLEDALSKNYCIALFDRIEQSVSMVGGLDSSYSISDQD